MLSNQEKTLVGAFSVIVITDGSFADLNKMFRFLKCAELCAAAGWRERREVWEEFRLSVRRDTWAGDTADKMQTYL